LPQKNSQYIKVLNADTPQQLLRISPVLANPTGRTENEHRILQPFWELSMSTKKMLSSLSNAEPDRLSFFGPPSLLKGEDPDAYSQLRAGLTSYVVPSDFIEEIWAREVADLTWDIIRWKRLKVALLNEAIERADGVPSIGKSKESTRARVIEPKLKSIERIDRLIMSAEMRRRAIFREIDRHRDRKQFAVALRTKLAEIEKAELETVPTAPLQPSS
jgi:hypothetical protein